jgi:16S rRNA (guanine527-N7)-methyltransferase
VDSLHLAAFLPGLGLPEEPECWDLGAGAGLPGIPLRVLWQDGRYTMVESREKRALFLRAALAALDLPRTAAVRARVEEFFRTAPPADCILSRAFMPWPELLALVAGRLAPGGRVVLLTREPMAGDAPAGGGWAVSGRFRYAVGGQNRYFIALERAVHAQ